jgi:Tol biopolymer transport system component
MRRALAAIVPLGLVLALEGAPAPTPAHLDVTVHEGTSMAVAVSPDGATLAIDLQGSIWTLPAGGGTATRITDIYNDARQPSWSPDGKWIAFFAYRDGGYDLWAIAPDGTHQHKLTWGAFDDREPIWSHDGKRIAFSSDRGNPLGSDYNIWMLDVGSGDLRQLTKNAADDYMPTWSPDDQEIAFTSTPNASLARQPAGASTRRRGGRAASSSTTSRAAAVAEQPEADRNRRPITSAPMRSPAARTSSRSVPRGPRRRRSTTCPTEKSASATSKRQPPRRSPSRRRCR